MWTVSPGPPGPPESGCKFQRVNFCAQARYLRAIGLRWGSHGPKGSPKRPQGSQREPKSAPSHPRGAQGALKGSHEHPKGSQRESKGTPKGTKRWPKKAKETPKDIPKRAKGSPKSPQRRPKDYIDKLPINRPSGRYVIIMRDFDTRLGMAAGSSAKISSESLIKW